LGKSSYNCKNQKIIYFMKKSILAVAVVLGATSLFAQKLESKNGEAYLPAAGDWAIGIDATPFLNYFGNLIGGGQGNNTAPTWNFLTNNQTITGKYFVEDDIAYRASLRLGFGSASDKVMVTDRAVTGPSTWPAIPAQVENKGKMSSMDIGLAVGLEKRRGFGRLQGYYGAELGFKLMSKGSKYEYGNALTTGAGGIDVDVAADAISVAGLAPVNITSDFDGTGTPNDARITETKSGLGFGIGLRAFIGAEYFVLPRLSIGGEFGWGLAFMSQGATSTTYETEGTTATGTVDQIETRTIEGSKSSSFGVDTETNTSMFGAAGSLRMVFHF
jgi:hypothetical protein